jgi:hypothetical protein
MKKWLGEKSDVSEHMPILRAYAKGCQHITEMGVRGVRSTWAFMMAKPKRLVSIDWDKSPFEVCREELAEVERLAKQNDIEFEFRSADTTSIEIENTDLLFIDTWHNYEQLLLELLMHSDNVSKSIIAHDTNEEVFPGMFCAIEDFIRHNNQWVIESRIEKFPGMTILKRIDTKRVDWGAFSKESLISEILVQRALYYEVVNESGPSGDAWWEYHNSLKARFADATRWPLTNQISMEA